MLWSMVSKATLGCKFVKIRTCSNSENVNINVEYRECNYPGRPHVAAAVHQLVCLFTMNLQYISSSIEIHVGVLVRWATRRVNDR